MSEVSWVVSGISVCGVRIHFRETSTNRPPGKRIGSVDRDQSTRIHQPTQVPRRRADDQIHPTSPIERFCQRFPGNQVDPFDRSRFGESGAVNRVDLSTLGHGPGGCNHQGRRPLRVAANKRKHQQGQKKRSQMPSGKIRRVGSAHHPLVSCSQGGQCPPYAEKTNPTVRRHPKRTQWPASEDRPEKTKPIPERKFPNQSRRVTSRLGRGPPSSRGGPGRGSTPPYIECGSP